MLYTPQEFAQAMAELAEKERFVEDMHEAMDDLMCEVLRELGYEEGIDIYEAQPKYYS